MNILRVILNIRKCLIMKCSNPIQLVWAVTPEILQIIRYSHLQFNNGWSKLTIKLLRNKPNMFRIKPFQNRNIFFQNLSRQWLFSRRVFHHNNRFLSMKHPSFKQYNQYSRRIKCLKQNQSLSKGIFLKASLHTTHLQAPSNSQVSERHLSVNLGTWKRRGRLLQDSQLSNNHLN